MARSDTRAKQKSSGGKYDNTGKPITQGVKYDNTGKPINSNSTPKPTPKTSSSTAKVPQGGAALPTKGNSAMAKLARSLITKSVGRLIPGVGLILTAVEVANYLGGRGKSEEQKLQDKLDELQSRYGKAKEFLERSGGMDTSRMKGANRLLSQIDEVKQQLKDLRGSVPQSKPSPSGPFPLKDYGEVKPAPRIRSAMDAARDDKERVGRAEERRYGSGSRSKKPIAKRIMEALGDNRTMEQATSDRKMTEEMEMEREMNVAGRKKGGMAKKKKAPVKKAYGGMVKKKQGGSANKVNMKAGFTRRGCSKG